MNIILGESQHDRSIIFGSTAYPEQGYALMFNPAGKGIDAAAVRTAQAQYPDVLLHVCFKDAPTAGMLAPLYDLSDEIILTYDQEPEDVDPSPYRTGVKALAKL